jgi:hypothetical protein
MVPLLLIHGPVPLDVSVDVLPAHTVSEPVIAAGSAFTVTSATAKQPDESE